MRGSDPSIGFFFDHECKKNNEHCNIRHDVKSNMRRVGAFTSCDLISSMYTSWDCHPTFGKSVTRTLC